VAIIAVFSGSFCHGEEVAGKVAKQLGYTRLEKKLFDEAEQKFGISRKKLIKAMKGSTSLFNKYTHEREKNIAYIQLALAAVIHDDNQLLHDFAIHLLPGTISHVLKVCIIANHDYRVEQAVKTESISEREAGKIIQKDDQERLDWTRYLFDRTPYDESLYDIVIPMHSTSVEEAYELICQHAGSEQLKKTPDSWRAVRDFWLASSVNIALVEEGHKVGVQAAGGKVTITINEYVVRLKHLENELKAIVKPISGVEEVKTVTGPKFKAPSANPWANIEVPPKILLVDDEKEYVHTLSERLETRDIETSVVYDGEQALDFVEKDEPDVMVLDLMMPGIDGIEVLRRIKRQRPHIEVIILTGHGSEREETLAEELGAFAYLKKPVDVNDLTQIMKKAYEKVSMTKNSMKKEKEEGKEKG
jgi:CheY-like chemotaxis protein